MARVPLVEPDALPPEKRSLLETLDTASENQEHSLEGGTLNVYRLLANDLDLLEAFRTYMPTVWAGGDLTPREREVVILAAAHASGSAYEWHQHVRVGLNAGLTAEEIRAVSGERDALSPDLAALAGYVDRFVEGSVDDATFDAVREHYGARTVLAVGQLAGAYLGLARQLAAMDVETEVPFVGWELENL